MTATLLAFATAGLLLGVPFVLVGARERLGGCCAHRHWAWVRAEGTAGTAYTSGGRRPARRPRVTEGE